MPKVETVYNSCGQMNIQFVNSDPSEGTSWITFDENDSNGSIVFAPTTTNVLKADGETSMLGQEVAVKI